MGAGSGLAQAWAMAYCKDGSENGVGTVLVGKNNGAHPSCPTEKSYMCLEYLQWVKKLPQCLHILERLAWCETMR